MFFTSSSSGTELATARVVVKQGANVRMFSRRHAGGPPDVEKIKAVMNEHGIVPALSQK